MTHDTAIETMAAERYLLDEMSEVERHRFEEHFFACAECAESLRIDSRLSRDAATLFAPAPAGRVAVHPAAMTARRRPSWIPSPAVAVPWAAAATLALALGLQVAGPGGGASDSDPRILATVALRPATRGAVTAVAVPPGDGHLALALDVNAGAPGDVVSYQLAREDGARLGTGSATVPPAGTPMVVLVAAAPLRAGGQFVLTLGPAQDAGTPPAEYRFTVNRQ